MLSSMKIKFFKFTSYLQKTVHSLIVNFHNFITNNYASLQQGNKEMLSKMNKLVSLVWSSFD